MTSDCEINMFVSESENKLRSEQKVISFSGHAGDQCVAKFNTPKW